MVTERATVTDVNRLISHTTTETARPRGATVECSVRRSYRAVQLQLYRVNSHVAHWLWLYVLHVQLYTAVAQHFVRDYTFGCP